MAPLDSILWCKQNETLIALYISIMVPQKDNDECVCKLIQALRVVRGKHTQAFLTH